MKSNKIKILTDKNKKVLEIYNLKNEINSFCDTGNDNLYIGDNRILIEYEDMYKFDFSPELERKCIILMFDLMPNQNFIYSKTKRKFFTLFSQGNNSIGISFVGSELVEFINIEMIEWDLVEKI